MSYSSMGHGHHATLHGLTLTIIDSVKNQPIMCKKTMVQLNQLLDGVNFGLGIHNDSLHKVPYYVVTVSPTKRAGNNKDQATNHAKHNSGTQE